MLHNVGNALLVLAGKTPPANDAAIELEKLSYWTDNGATYYYNTNAPLGIGSKKNPNEDTFVAHMTFIRLILFSRNCIPAAIIVC